MVWYRNFGWNLRFLSTCLYITRYICTETKHFLLTVKAGFLQDPRPKKVDRKLMARTFKNGLSFALYSRRRFHGYDSAKTFDLFHVKFLKRAWTNLFLFSKRARNHHIRSVLTTLQKNATSIINVNFLLNFRQCSKLQKKIEIWRNILTSPNFYENNCNNWIVEKLCCRICYLESTDVHNWKHWLLTLTLLTLSFNINKSK